MIARLALLLPLLVLRSPVAWAWDDGGYETVRDVAYHGERAPSDYAAERCRLDLYRPTGTKGYATVVWFHGGGLKGGGRSVPKGLWEQGIAVVAVDYRLSPRAKSPAYLEDAAAAVAWTMKNVERYGGDPQLVFVSGHSAGGFLTSMIGLDDQWLAAHDLDPNDLAGLLPYSGQTVTHSTIREERGIPGTRPVVDEFAPLYHVRRDTPPILLITGDRELELRGRYEENAYLARMLKVVGHREVTLYELDGYDHGGMAEPAHPLLLKFVRRIVADRAATTR